MKANNLYIMKIIFLPYPTTPKGRVGVNKCKNLKLFKGSRVTYQIKAYYLYITKIVFLPYPTTPKGRGGVNKCTNLNLLKSSRVTYQMKAYYLYITKIICFALSDHTQRAWRGQ